MCGVESANVSGYKRSPSTTWSEPLFPRSEDYDIRTATDNHFQPPDGPPNDRTIIKYAPRTASPEDNELPTGPPNDLTILRRDMDGEIRTATENHFQPRTRIHDPDRSILKYAARTDSPDDGDHERPPNDRTILRRSEGYDIRTATENHFQPRSRIHNPDRSILLQDIEAGSTIYKARDAATKGTAPRSRISDGDVGPGRSILMQDAEFGSSIYKARSADVSRAFGFGSTLETVVHAKRHGPETIPPPATKRHGPETIPPPATKRHGPETIPPVATRVVAGNE